MGVEDDNKYIMGVNTDHIGIVDGNGNSRVYDWNICNELEKGQIAVNTWRTMLMIRSL